MTTQSDKILWLTDMDGDWLKIRVQNPRAICENLRDGKTYDIEIKQHREKRSLDANALAWVLIGKLAMHYDIPADDVYRQFVRMVGPYEIIPVKESVAERWPSIWGANGIGFLCDDMGPCRRLSGYRQFKCYYGSHVYNTKEMSRLIDSIMDECKLAGIETMEPDKLNALLEEWDAPRDESKSNQP